MQFRRIPTMKSPKIKQHPPDMKGELHLFLKCQGNLTELRVRYVGGNYDVRKLVIFQIRNGYVTGPINLQYIAVRKLIQPDSLK